MYARLISGQFLPGKVQEGTALYRDFLRETQAERRKRGSIKGTILMSSTEASRMIQINLFATEGEMAKAPDFAAQYAPFQAVMAKLRTLGVAGSQVNELYEVAVRDILPGAVGFARVGWSEILPGRSEAAGDFWREERGKFRRPEGSRGTLILADRTAGRVVRANFWESEAAQRQRVGALAANKEWQEYQARVQAATKPWEWQVFGVVYGDLEGVVGSFIGDAPFQGIDASAQPPA